MKGTGKVLYRRMGGRGEEELARNEWELTNGRVRYEEDKKEEEKHYDGSQTGRKNRSS